MKQICVVVAAHFPVFLNRLFPYQRLSRIASGDKVTDKYFDQDKTHKMFLKASQNLYLPFLKAVEQVAKEAEKLGVQFKIGFSPSGLFVENAIRHGREVHEAVSRLVKSGNLELVAAPYYHSLASTYPDKMGEFEYQVRLFKALVQKVYGVEPQVLANTHLIFSDGVASVAEREGLQAVITDSVSEAPGVYTHTSSKIKVIVRDYELSSAVAEGRYEAITNAGNKKLVYIDLERTPNPSYEKFRFLLSSMLSQGAELLSPSELLLAEEPIGSITQPEANPAIEKDVGSVSALLGNPMQRIVYHRLVELAPYVKQVGDRDLLILWRLLQQSDVLASLSEDKLPGYAVVAGSPIEAYTVIDSIISDFEGKVASSYYKMLQAKKSLTAPPLK